MPGIPEDVSCNEHKGFVKTHVNTNVRPVSLHQAGSFTPSRESAAFPVVCKIQFINTKEDVKQFYRFSLIIKFTVLDLQHSVSGLFFFLAGV